MARVERHLPEVLGVPGADQDPSRVRVLLDQIDGVLDLVDRAAFALRPLDPLDAVDGTEVTVLGGELRVVDDSLLVGADLRFPCRRVRLRNRLSRRLKVLLERPVAPDVNVPLDQVPDVAVAHQEPEQLLGDEPEGHALSRDQREAIRHVVLEGRVKDAARPRTGAIGTVIARVADLPKKILILCVNQLCS